MPELPDVPALPEETINDDDDTQDNPLLLVWQGRNARVGRAMYRIVEDAYA